MSRFDTRCNVCGESAFRPLAIRSDGIPVIACTVCGHGIVEHFRDDVLEIYNKEYYGAADPAFGYSEYAYTGEHGLAWARALVPLICRGGAVLDIGCADGRALQRLGPEYSRFGIEASEAMAAVAAGTGIRILGNDLLAPALRRDFTGSMDLALAIAVFEHIPDLRGSVEAALALLKPEGVLVFETPLVRSSDDIWFRSSLEHLHYPSEASMRYLFDEVLKAPLWGAAVEAQDFGWLYVGVASKSSEAARAVGDCMQRLTTAPPAKLPAAEARFRFLFDVIHCAKTAPELLALLPSCEPADLNPLLLRRIADLWGAREMRLNNTAAYLKEVEEARDWHADQTRRRDEVIGQKDDVIRRLEASIRGGDETVREREEDMARPWWKRRI